MRVFRRNRGTRNNSGCWRPTRKKQTNNRMALLLRNRILLLICGERHLKRWLLYDSFCSCCVRASLISSSDNPLFLNSTKSFKVSKRRLGINFKKWIRPKRRTEQRLFEHRDGLCRYSPLHWLKKKKIFCAFRDIQTHKMRSLGRRSTESNPNKGLLRYI